MGKNITATHIYNYVKCPCSLFLEFHGDPSEKLDIAEFVQKKMRDGLVHEKEVIKNKDFFEVVAKDTREAFEKTLEAMKRGEKSIYQGVLIDGDLVGKPDLLIKKPGESIFGEFHYIPADIKSGKNLKKEYVMQVMFYCRLLENVQKKFPEKGRIINSQAWPLEFKTFEQEEDFEILLQKVRGVVNGKTESPAMSSNCNMCVWREHCTKELVEKEDASLIYKLSRNIREKLGACGVHSLKDVEEVDDATLLQIKGVGKTSVKKWKLMAKSMREKRPIVIKKPDLPERKVEIFFDIEGEPEMEVDYLYGCLVRENSKEKYIPFWATKPQDEEKMWREFCKFIEGLEDDFVVYYYTSYEVRSIERMVKLYGCKPEVYRKITKNMVDLFPIVTKSVILPLCSYSIKPIAKWLGFRWRAPDAGGAQSMYWYAKYLDGDENFRQVILDYNEDDVIATRVLKDWLAGLEKDTL